jgi:hypothetical protein
MSQKEMSRFWNWVFYMLFFSCGAAAQTSQCNQKKYSVEIVDYDFSMAYTICYHVVDDSLIITWLNGIVGGRDSCLVAKKISEGQSEEINKFLSTLNLRKLKDKYENPNVQDGDRKTVTICFKDKVKTIEINNIYQKDMANLFAVVNQIVDAKFKINYKQ